MTKTQKPTSTLRAIHINPFAQSVAEVAMPDDFEAVKRDFLQCDLADCIHLGGGVDAWVDDEGTLINWDAQGFVRLGGQITLAGHVMLTGVNERCGVWADLPAHITVAHVRALCQFLTPQEVELPGDSITTFDSEERTTTEYLGPQVRTYDNQQ